MSQAYLLEPENIEEFSDLCSQVSHEIRSNGRDKSEEAMEETKEEEEKADEPMFVTDDGS